MTNLLRGSRIPIINSTIGRQVQLFIPPFLSLIKPHLTLSEITMVLTRFTGLCMNKKL
jgi:hypothetical protein